MQSIADNHRKALMVDERAAEHDFDVAVLRQLDYQAEAVSSAEGALARLAREPFALILLSSTLPDMGPALTEEIRRLTAPLAAPIVVVHPTNEAAGRACADAGVTGHVSRPISSGSIRELVEPREAAREPVVDMDHLLSFTDGNLELESELSALFLSSAEAYFDKMSRSLQEAAKWSSSAHALKGASANLGARRLATLARSAEHQPPDAADLEVIRRAIDEVSVFLGERQRAAAKSSRH